MKITENLNNSLAILEDTLAKSQSDTEKPANALVGFISAKRAAKEMTSNMKNTAWYDSEEARKVKNKEQNQEVKDMYMMIMQPQIKNLR